MKIIVVSISAVVVLLVSLLTIKFWGRGQVYSEYKHAIFQTQALPVEFIKPNYEHLEETIRSDKNIYLDLSITFDQKLVLLRRPWRSDERPVRLYTYDEIKNDVLLLSDFKEILKKKKIIFNFIENAPAVHESFMYEMKKMELDKGDNFIVTSAYEAPIKALKEIAPALVYGSTQPEILKILAMRSMYLLEAATLRADVIIHPLKIRKQNFYSEDIMSELQKRYKKIIVGPINNDELSAARELNPFGIIINY